MPATPTQTAEGAARPGELPDPTEGRTILGHPVGLAYIVFTEAWERFSFFGMQALLVLYMASYVLHGGVVESIVGFAGLRAALEWVFGELSVQALATQIFGIYIGLIYLMPVFGGLLGDRFLGRTRAVVIGAIAMALGHFLLAFEAWFLVALVLLVIGSGLLKGNLAAQVGGLYEKTDQRRDSAFAIYHVGISIGATIAPLVCGTLGELYGWHYGFGAAGIGMLVGLVIYLSGLKYMPPDAALRADGQRPKLAPGDGRIIASLLLLFLIATFFWAAQTQVWNTYPLWIRGHVDRDLFDLLVPVTWFQSVDAIAVVVLAPVVLWFWKRQADRGREPGDFSKIAIGYAVQASAFVWLALGQFLAAEEGVALFWPLLFHFILAIGFLYTGPIILSLVSRAAPDAVNAMMVGSYYISIFFGGILSGWLGRYYEVLPAPGFWLLHAAIVGVGFVSILVLRGPLSRGMKLQTPMSYQDA